MLILKSLQLAQKCSDFHKTQRNRFLRPSSGNNILSPKKFFSNLGGGQFFFFCRSKKNMIFDRPHVEKKKLTKKVFYGEWYQESIPLGLRVIRVLFSDLWRVYDRRFASCGVSPLKTMVRRSGKHDFRRFRRRHARVCSACLLCQGFPLHHTYLKWTRRRYTTLATDI